MKYIYATVQVQLYKSKNNIIVDTTDSCHKNIDECNIYIRKTDCLLIQKMKFKIHMNL